MSDKRKNRQYTQQQLENAIRMTNEGTDAWEAAKSHGIPYQTLSDRLNGRYKSSQVGAKSILSKEDEMELVNWIRNRAKLGYPLSKKEFTDAAVKVANRRGKKTFGPKGPSRSWFKHLMQKHPRLSLRKPEGLSKGSAEVTTANIEAFMCGIKSYIEEKGLAEFLKSHPENVINMDETSFELNAKPDKVLTYKDIPHTYYREAATHHNKVSSTVTIGADGKMRTPQIILKESFTKGHEAAFAAGFEQQKIFFSSSANGWQTSATFCSYVKEIIREMRAAGIKGTIVLICDGFAGHMSFELQTFCNENDVLLIILYPNATHLIQPLDVAVFKSVKAEFNSQSTIYKQVEKKVDLTEVDFVKIFCRTLKAVVTPDLVKKSFETTGWYPLNPVFQHPERIVAESLACSLRDTPPASVTPSELLARISALEQELSLMRSIQVPSTAALQQQPAAVPASGLPLSAVSTFPAINSTPQQSISASPSPNLAMPQHTQFSAASTSQSALSDILVIPQAQAKTRKRTFKIMKHGVMSSTAMIEAIKEQEREKELKKQEAVDAKRARMEKKEVAMQAKQEAAAKKLEKKQEKLNAPKKKPPTNVTKSKKGKKVEPAKTPEEPKSQPLIDPAKMEKIENFLVKAKEIESQNELRKEELKDLEILNCHDLSNEKLRQIVQSSKEKILELFSKQHRARTIPIIDGLKYDGLAIGSANVLSENQHGHVLNEIEKCRDVEARGTLADVLHEVVMPYIIVVIFKETFNYSIENALDRVIKQDEKLTLDDTNSYDSQ